jgi:predicted SnoaL-like aldol condensation-catalyzing enzyme
MTKKQTAQHFLQLAASGNARQAFALYAADGFKHHNPFFKGDAATLMQAMDDNAKQNPDKIFDIQRALEDGDGVAVHSHVRQSPTDAGAAVIHIFRFEGDKIAELWDVGQAMPDGMVNEFGMF